MLWMFRYFYSIIKWNVLTAVKGDSYAARSLGVKLGQDCRVYTRNFGMEPWLITIGDRVTVTAGVEFITHDGASWLLRDEKGRRYHHAPIEIGSDVFIGSNSIIMPRVKVGNRVIIAAGSVVSRSIPDNCVVGGVPARFIKTFDDYERYGLAHFPSDEDIKGIADGRKQVETYLDKTMAPEIEVPASVRAGNRSEV